MREFSRRIIWAVDPFADDRSLQRSAARAIRALSQGARATVQPVYLFSACIFEKPFELPTDLARQIRIEGQDELDGLLTGISIEGLEPLHVIAEPYLAQREGVEEVAAYARSWRADMVVTGTHARKGIRRWFMGSFAETLILYSNLPVVAVNPTWAGVARLEHILFATDFSDESHEALGKVMELAASTRGQITLFHKLEYEWPLTIDASFYTFPYYTDHLTGEIEETKQTAAKWVEEAKRQGVEMESVIDFRPQGSAADAILAQAAKRPGLIALSSHSGPARAALLGSTARKVVRGATQPVWVLHPAASAHADRPAAPREESAPELSRKAA